MNNYAIDLGVEGTNNFVYSGAMVKATRTSKAIKKAETLFPGRKIKVRLVREGLAAVWNNTKQYGKVGVTL